jgi:hypothetical protein
MRPSILPSPPEGSELARWVAEGFRREPTHSNIVYFGSPDERFVLVVQVDDPVQGYLVELHLKDVNDSDTPPLGRTIVDDREYYYLQWREGDRVKSQYVAPVSPAS